MGLIELRISDLRFTASPKLEVYPFGCPYNEGFSNLAIFGAGKLPNPASLGQLKAGFC